MKTVFLSNVALVLLIVSNIFWHLNNADYTKTNSHDASAQTSVTPDPLLKEGSQELINPQGIAPSITFNENPYNHNMHITCDGSYYYTINGGGVSYGQINKFSLTGALIKTYPILIDGRGLSYNSSDKCLYASLNGGDIVKITDLTTGSFTKVFSSGMQNGQASFAISDDGTKYYDFYSGTLKVHDFKTGSVLQTLTGLSYGSGNFGGNSAVAVDSKRIYTCDANAKIIYIYDQSGTFIQTLTLNSGDNGHSLSYANGYLFMSIDGNYKTGTWFGYNVTPNAPGK